MTDAQLVTGEVAVGSREEIERIRRVSDQLCTAHAALRDHYSRKALALDLSILLLSAWLTAFAFIDPRFYAWIERLGLDALSCIGFLAVVTFCLTLVQFKTDWKGRSEAHQRSFGMYSEVKREAGYLLASSADIPSREFQRLAARYDMASDVGTGIPEKEFLALKKRHKVKVEISKLLDHNPGASISLTKLKLFFRDNSLWRR